MTFKNLGSDISQSPTAVLPGAGQFTADDHSFEQLVFAQGNPPLDWEMTLLQEISGQNGLRRLNKSLRPSGWTTSLLNKANAGCTFLTPDPPGATTANKFRVDGSTLCINGWLVDFNLSETSTYGQNQITLPAPPNSGSRTDFVFLEVWRALVSGDDPLNKSPSGQILRFGNAKAPDSGGNQNLADDLIDPDWGVATSKRVQIQYRYRVVSNLSNLATYPDGLDSPLVTAKTVPYQSGSTVDGATTVLTYSHVGGGLYVAGAGDSGSATTLGTVDGLIYAIPLFAVARRNTTAFNRATNLNGGGLMSSGVSGRPDGLYADQIVSGDVRDLRKSLVQDLEETSIKSFNQVLDNTLDTQFEISSDGPAGVNFLSRDNIGVSGKMGNPDGIRRRFSDRPVVESVMAEIPLLSGAQNFVVSLASLKIRHFASPLNIPSIAPVGTEICGIGRIRLNSSVGFYDFDLLDQNSVQFVTSALVSQDTNPNDQVEIDLSDPIDYDSTIFVELLIAYPANLGVKRNLRTPIQLWTPPAANIAAWVNSSFLSNTSDANRKSLNSVIWKTDNGHREVDFSLQSNTDSFTVWWDGAVDLDGNALIYVPDRVVAADLSYTSILGPENYTVSSNDIELGSGYTRIKIDASVNPDAIYSQIDITFTASRAAPPVSGAPGDSYQVFYQTSAVQSVPVPAGTQTLNLIPRHIQDNLHIMTSGSGGQGMMFPFKNPSDQIPVGVSPPVNYPEASIQTPPVTRFTGFTLEGGYVKTPALVPYVPDSDMVSLYRDAIDNVVDADGRNFWPKSDDGSPAVYTPYAQGQNLLNHQVHRISLPVIMELKQDFPSIGPKGSLVLVIFTYMTNFNKENVIRLFVTEFNGAAAVYRLRGNPILPSRPLVRLP